MPETNLRLALLRALAARGTAHPYQRPVIEGYSQDDVDAELGELRRGGYVLGWDIPPMSIDAPSHWAPSVLTEKGRQLLSDLEMQQGGA